MLALPSLISRTEKRTTKPKIPAKKSLAIFKKFASKFLLFDWEFFSNELEYE